MATITGDAGSNTLVGTTGNDSLSALEGDDSLSGLDGFDTLNGGAGNDTLDGGASYDTATYSTDSAGVNASLLTGSATGAAIGTDVLINIERLTGGSGNDSLTGDSKDNTLTGNGGSNTFNGGGGGDSLVGASGFDTAVYTGAIADYTFFHHPQGGSAFGVVDNRPGSPDGADNLNNVELLQFSDGTVNASQITDFASSAQRYFLWVGHTDGDVLSAKDNLVGPWTTYWILARGGDDTISGLQGGDFVDAGDGNDSVAADWGHSTISGGAGNDTFNAYHGGIFGGNFTAGVFLIDGGGGDDSFIGVSYNNTDFGGPPEADTLTGGTGSDIYQLLADTSLTPVADTITDFQTGVGGDIIDISAIMQAQGNPFVAGYARLFQNGPDTLFQWDRDAGGASYTWTTTLILQNTSAVTFAAANFAAPNNYDPQESASIIGDGGNNSLSGTIGDDDISGLGGNDTVDGDTGNDTIDGGPGNDSLVGGIGTDTASFGSDTAGVNASLATNTATGSLSGSDTLSGFENLTGGSGNDTLSGNGNANTLAGLAGNDSLIGGAGNDSLDGGEGNDILLGGGGSGAGDDTLSGGNGTDQANYGSDTLGVTVNLGASTATGGSIGNDVLSGIENVIGGGGADTLTGDANGNQLTGNNGNDVLNGSDGNDTLTGAVGNDTLIGGNGIDAANYNTDTLPGGLSANLSTGLVSGDALVGNDSLSGIENLNGGSGADTLTGDGNANNIAGNLGDDVIDGGNGDDTLMGGPGDDSVIGGGGNDSLVGGSDGDDTLTGGIGNDTLTGGTGIGITGDKILAGGQGNDSLDGGDSDGTRVADYRSDPGAVTVDLSAGNATDGWGDHDALAHINAVAGSIYNDTILGGVGDETFVGNAGTDSIDGGGGLNTLYYGLDPAGVIVDLAGGIATDGFGNTDHFVNIQKVVGSTFDDSIAGDSSDNYLVGGDDETLDGNDTLNGGAGNDTLDGGAGDDAINDGDGVDTVVFSGAWTDYSISLSGSTYTVTDNRSSSPDGTDTVTNAENVAFSNGAFAIAEILNDAPVAAADTATALEAGGSANDIPGTNPSANVFPNDTDADSVLGDTKTVLGVAAGTLSGPLSSGVASAIVGAFGSLSLSADGGYSYTVDNSNATVQALNSSGHLTDIFTYTIKDSAGLTSTSTLTVTIYGANDAPSQPVDTNAAANSVMEGAANGTAVGITASSSDVDNAGITYSLTDSAGGRFAIDSSSGVVTAANAALLNYDVATGYSISVAASDGTLSTPASTIFNISIVNASGVVINGGVTNDLVDALHTVAGQFLPTSNDDAIFGLGGDDTLDGGAGNDTIDGGPGNDSLVGGIGIDAASFGSDTAGVNASLGTNISTGSLSGSDTLSGIENLTGGSGNDTLSGNGNANILLGLGGNDSLVGGAGNDSLDGGEGNDTLGGGGANGAGDDTLSGGNGTDQANYGNDTLGVTVDLGAGTATGGSAGNDVLSGIENVIGGGGADTLTGDANGNQLTGNNGNDVLNGSDGNDTLTGAVGNDTLIGGNGIDAANYNTDTLPGGLSANLSTGVVTGGPLVGNDSLSGIENLNGGSGADTLTGDGNANNLAGNLGDDVIDGGNGDDTLMGGPGDDSVIGGGGNDSLVGGSDGDDTLTGGIGNDTLTGGTGIGITGDKLLAGGQGNDSLDGGDSDGTRVADYRSDAGAVSVDLSTGNATDGWGDHDILAHINAVAGSIYNDTLLGGAGDDIFVGNAGTDSIDGGGGLNTLYYGLDPAGVVVDLAGGNATDGFGNTDHFVNIQKVVGSTFDDSIAGDSSDNYLVGGDDETLDGNDTIAGGDGNDTLDGGVGNDVASFVGDIAGVNANLATGTATGARSGNDVLFGFEYVAGGSGNDTLTGDAGANRLEGNAGNDRLSGGAGNDTLDGGAGTDTAIFSGVHSAYVIRPGGTTVSGPDGTDTLIGVEKGLFADGTFTLHTAVSDFDGDGNSDFLFQQDNFQPDAWLMNGSTIASAGPIHFINQSPANPGPGWHIKGSGDFNSDGSADIIWQEDNGNPAIWLVNGLQLSSGGYIVYNDLTSTNPGTSWHIEGSGDFNSDGNADLLWQNDDGMPAIWLINGFQISSGGYIVYTNLTPASPGPTWHIKGAADFNGDGNADVLWQDDLGNPAIWLVNGFVLSSGGYIVNPDLTPANLGAGWHIKSAGDFDGDGKSDVVWQHDDGRAAIWLIDGFALRSSTIMPTNPGPAWDVTGAGDYNGDGKADIQWQNDNGQPMVWLMDGTTVLASVNVGSNPGADWHLDWV